MQPLDGAPAARTAGIDRLGSDEITLEPLTHTYRLARRPELEFTSCTQFVGSFFEPFEDRRIAERLVRSSPRYRGRTVEQILAEWKRAGDEGTRIHEEIECALTDGTPPATDRSRRALDWLEATFSTERWEYFPERIVYSEALGLAGTTDLLLRHRRNAAWVVLDWKTNRAITRNGYAGKRGIRGPARALDDCHLVKYGLQLSLYGYLLETCYGIEPRRLAMVHLAPGGPEPIPVDNARRKILELLAHEKLIPDQG